MQREMERLEQLTLENASLRQEVAQLQAQLKARESRPVQPAAVNPELPALHGSTVRPDVPFEGATGPSAARTSGMSTYRVKQGDTLYSIARRHGLTEAALRAANPDVIPTRMSAGQEIRIPAR
jgi:LysM repeat protein